MSMIRFYLSFFEYSLPISCRHIVRGENDVSMRRCGDIDYGIGWKDQDANYDIGGIGE